LIGWGGCVMPVWEYHQIDLNDLPPKTEEVDVLNELDAEGWELVGTIVSRTSSVAETTVSGAPRRRGGPLARSDGRARDRSAGNGPVGLLGLMGRFQPQMQIGPCAAACSEDRRRRLAAAAPAWFLWAAPNRCDCPPSSGAGGPRPCGRTCCSAPTCGLSLVSYRRSLG
jgi:hypothetical protein